MANGARAKKWSDNWQSVGDAVGGGQADAKHVRRSDGSDQRTYFLKILRHQNDPMRRKRMYREVSAYKTLNHPGIPRLVDTNVEEYEDNNYKLFLVTELVEGPTLDQVVADKGPLSLEDAISAVAGLLAIIEYCHQNETVHRDIKPDNVMVANGDPTKPVLVDFGLSFNQLEPEGIRTLSDEELGNRFCRLPELGPPSSAKRDPRSDVTFCAGLLLFALTARAPGMLLDEQNRMPHQRPEVRAELESRVPLDVRSALYHIFDQSFRIDVRHRWQSATELRVALQSMLKSGGSTNDVTALRQHIASYARRPDITAMGELSGNLKKARRCRQHNRKHPDRVRREVYRFTDKLQQSRRRTIRRKLNRVH